MKREPARQQQDLHRHHRHASPGDGPVQRQQRAREHVGAGRPAVREDRLAGAHHMRRTRIVADHLQCEIGFHTGRDVEAPAFEQRPAAILTLFAAQIRGDLALELKVGRFAQPVHQQHVFGRDRRVRFQFEHEMPIGPLLIEQSAGRLVDRLLQRSGCESGRNQAGFRFGQVSRHIQNVGPRGPAQALDRSRCPNPRNGARQAHQLDPDLADRVVRHHSTPWRNAVSSRRVLPRLTRRRGAAKPRCSILSRISE